MMQSLIMGLMGCIINSNGEIAMDRKNCSGVTLVELLAAVSVGGILMFVAIPAVTDMLRAAQLSSQTRLFISAVNYARTAAVERQRNVFMCAGNSGGCQNSRHWDIGWLVFADDNGNFKADAEEILHVFDALEPGYRLTPNVLVYRLLFLPSGNIRRGSKGLPLMTFRMCSPDARDGNLAKRSREIVINAVGRMRLQFGREILGAC